MIFFARTIKLRFQIQQHGNTLQNLKVNKI
jgi:hypothetical protein